MALLRPRNFRTRSTAASAIPFTRRLNRDSLVRPEVRRACLYFSIQSCSASLKTNSPSTTKSYVSWMGERFFGFIPRFGVSRQCLQKN